VLKRLPILLILSLVLLSCGTPETSATSTPGVAQTEVATPTTPPTTSPPSAPTTFTLWVPPYLSPETQAGALFHDHVETFAQSYAGVSFSVRIKRESGPGGLLETLASASAAAPSTLPDILALDAASLEAAAYQGLIIPLEDLLPETILQDLYDHAFLAAEADGVVYGLPFASDALVLAYRLDLYASPPTTWSELNDGPAPFIFPAGDTTAEFTLAQYLSLNGPLNDGEGNLTLDPGILADVLTFIRSLRTAGVIQLSSLQYDTPDETWQAMLEGRAASALAPFSSFMAQHNPSINLALPLPTRAGRGLSFSETWSWAVVAQDPTRQEIAIELLQWLSEPTFLATLTYDLGFLPSSSAALGAWPDDANASVASQLVLVSRPALSEEILNTFGPVLQISVDAVIRGTQTPEEAALAAQQAIENP
jgi:multiple sugar transport system substrate-binding protein